MNKCVNLTILICCFSLQCSQKESDIDKIHFRETQKVSMKFQEFNEVMEEYGSSIFYKGFYKDTVDLKYYEDLSTIPPPPEDHKSTLKEIQDSIKREKLESTFFRKDKFPSLFDLQKYDSINSKNIFVEIRNKDTIPQYVKTLENNIKAYKAMPVIFKNISGRKITIPIYKSLGFQNKDEKENWNYIRNNN